MSNSNVSYITSKYTRAFVLQNLLNVSRQMSMKAIYFYDLCALIILGIEMDFRGGSVKIGPSGNNITNLEF